MTPFAIDLTDKAQSSLEAHSLLQTIDNSATFHTKNDLRPALGIYNVSVSRVLRKVGDLCERLEMYALVDREEANYTFREKTANSLVDYIELSLYAAAEHVDDLAHITKHFYRSDRERASCKAYKVFQGEIKLHKRFIAAAANYIKHSQHRIRLYELGYTHSGHRGAFHGYVIENVKDGVVGPSPIFHTDQRRVFSSTSLVWEIIVFVLKASRSLAAFLANRKRVEGPVTTIFSSLPDAVVAAARLPLYQFDEDHPFEAASLVLRWDEPSRLKASSGLYGSIYTEWDRVSALSIGESSVAFAGDGITRTFNMLVQPTRAGLKHWGRA